VPDANSNFDSIYAEFQPKILRYLTGLVGPNEAEDISQIVFLNVHGGLKDFRGEASLATWIYRIATNAAIDRLRKGSFGEADKGALNSDFPSDATYECEAANVAGNTEAPSAETSFIRSEMNECIKTFVDTLPEIYRPVIVLSDLEGFKNREIAEILGLSVDTVKIRLHRARRELRKRFETGCDFYRTEANELACDRKASESPSNS
jgi:RNA polymerase sigma-70 factor (ECF subfamily)